MICCNGYRKRINQEFKGGEVVVVTLKNRSLEQTPDEEDWYEKAFGPKQNMMEVKIHVQPEKDHLRRKKNDLYAECKYEMFPEMAGEFKKEDHPEK